jgi:histidinol-phosphatase (PHP family)
MMIEIKSTDIFHVHTYRCGHAEEVGDEEYVIKAIELGATGIWFTDHAPFPGDPFRGRMKYEGLDGYINGLLHLKEKYKNKVDVHIGLEIEYFPSYDRDGYYRELKSKKALEFMALGQHMAEVGNDEYSFSWGKEELEEKECLVLCDAIVEGMKTGFFDVCVHPDRSFRRKKLWDETCSKIAERIWKTAAEGSIPLEQNESSKRHKNHYRKEFWKFHDCYSEVEIVRGFDAHFLKELKPIITEPQV